MTRRLDVDRLLDDWLAEGPSQMSDRTFEAIVQGLDTKKQRRSAWLPRREQMNRFVLAAGALAAVALAVVVGISWFSRPGAPGVGGPGGSSGPTGGPTATASEAPTSDALLFTSERHRYSVRLPDDRWSVTEVDGEWESGTMFTQDGPGVDRLVRDDDAYTHDIFLNSQAIPESMTYEEWLADYTDVLSVSLPCRLQGELETTVVDGETARLGEYECGGERGSTPSRAVDVVWSHEGRAYVFRVGEDPVSSEPIEPRSVAEEWLARITHLE